MDTVEKKTILILDDTKPIRLLLLKRLEETVAKTDYTVRHIANFNF